MARNEVEGHALCSRAEHVLPRAIDRTATEDRNQTTPEIGQEAVEPPKKTRRLHAVFIPASSLQKEGSDGGEDYAKLHSKLKTQLSFLLSSEIIFPCCPTSNNPRTRWPSAMTPKGAKGSW